MKIRSYQIEDCKEILSLFYHTVHEVNAADYSKEQLDVWATGAEDLDRWQASFEKNHCLVAEEDGIIVGFGDIHHSGYLDRLYVDKDHQGRGIATALCKELEQMVMDGHITTHASITAKPFFEKRGYRVLKEQQVIRQGVALTNYVMEKSCDD